MSDYDYCKKHDVSFLMPELLMCPKCAVDAVMRGDVKEPLGDALREAITMLRTDSKWYPATNNSNSNISMKGHQAVHVANVEVGCVDFDNQAETPCPLRRKVFLVGDTTDTEIHDKVKATISRKLIVRYMKIVSIEPFSGNLDIMR